MAWGGAVAALALACLAAAPGRRALALELVGWFPVAAILVGLRLHDPRRRWGWRWLLAAQASLAIGNVGRAGHGLGLGGLPGSGFGWSDPFHLAAFLSILVGMALLIRARGGRLEQGIDAAMLAATVGLVSWVFLVGPTIDDTSVYGAAEARALAYPAASVVVIGMTAWLCLVPGRRSPSSIWLMAGHLAWFTACMAHGRRTLDGVHDPGSWLDLAFAAGYLAVGAAALHPTMAQVCERTSPPPPRSADARLVSIGAAALVGPVLLAAASLAGVEVDVAEVAVGCSILFLLALLRTAGLVGALERQARALTGQRAALDLMVSRLHQAHAERRHLLDQALVAAELERTALAAELHDGPIQHMTAVSLHLDLARMSLDSADADQARAELLEAQEGLEREVGGLRRVMAGLRPPALDEGGLLHAVHDHVRAFREWTGISCTVSGQVPHRLDRAVETILYRVVQESLSNVARHAGADAVDISLVVEDGSVTLTVRDDGVGFATEGRDVVSDHTRLGVVRMKERVEIGGGIFTVESTAGAGTLVRAVMPAYDTEGSVELAPANSAG